MVTQVLKELGETSKLMNETFSFHQAPKNWCEKLFLNLDSFKATSAGNISLDRLKYTVDIHLPFIICILKTIYF